jgi:hypothetical protein
MDVSMVGNYICKCSSDISRPVARNRQQTGFIKPPTSQLNTWRCNQELGFLFISTGGIAQANTVPNHPSYSGHVSSCTSPSTLPPDERETTVNVPHIQLLSRGEMGWLCFKYYRSDLCLQKAYVFWLHISCSESEYNPITTELHRIININLC